MDTSPRVSEDGVATGGSVWLQKHLWLASDSKEPYKRRSKQEFISSLLEDTRAQIFWVLGPRTGPFLLLLHLCCFSLSSCRPAFSVSLVHMLGNLGTDCS